TGLSKVNELTFIHTTNGDFKAEKVILTTSLPVVSKIISNLVEPDFIQKLSKIKYIGNVCLVIALNKSLSDYYWLNVNDPNFPFVGIIEHTNFQFTSDYNGKHVVYVSKYLPTDDVLYTMPDKELLNYYVLNIKRIFPEFSIEQIIDFKIWRERYSQPIIERDYSEIIPDYKLPIDNVFLCTMAQIYPEDRGTNYAVREGRKIGRVV
ncbi:MAG: amine oxidase, partial [Nitrospira sp.]|nr:amine oxidase [Nitrospira sp.]